jgi:hypothetical protein
MYFMNTYIFLFEMFLSHVYTVLYLAKITLSKVAFKIN